MDLALEVIIAKVQQSRITLKAHFTEIGQRAESIARMEKCLGNLNVSLRNSGHAFAKR